MSKESNNAIEVKNLSKHFKLPTEHSTSLKQIVINWTKGVKGYKKQQVLKNISFNVEKGDFFGIVGRNGSGKSTLLKLISGIYTPDSGSIKINGSLVSFIELGVGFNPELTGRENVYLNGALLGFTVKEIDEMYDEIVDFAELRDFMDQKLKNYSSGMQVRLAFSCAIRAKSDILVLDEVLAVGDEAFQQKCNDYFYSAKKDKRTIILVTHSMSNVREFCNKAILVNDGKIEIAGNPDKVASAYSKIFQDEYIAELNKENKDDESKVVKQLSDIELISAKIKQNNKNTKAVHFKKPFVLELKFKSPTKHDGLTIGAHLINQAGMNMLSLSSKAMTRTLNIKDGETKIVFEIENVFSEGKYYFNVALERNEDKKLLFQQQELADFSVVGMDRSKYSSFGETYVDFNIEVK